MMSKRSATPTSLTQARALDRQDPLRKYRRQFALPRHGNKPCIYFCGNSLGLMLQSAQQLIGEELRLWQSAGVEGHFTGKRPWMYYHRQFTRGLAAVTGARADEVVAMNQLTVNLHLMLVSFYRPTATRYKIITEAGAFSSDQYAVETQIRNHGLNPDEALIEIAPRAGEYTLRTEDIISTLQQHGDSTALILLGGVQYYTGQWFDLRAITRAAHAVGAWAGFDLAHAVGNVPLHLHRDEVDFAVWCSYKYLNGGPGAVAGAFVHQRHHQSALVRLAGWWGHQESERFRMQKGFKPMAGAEGWQLSNFPVLAGTALLASLRIFQEAGVTALRRKSLALTGSLRQLLHSVDPAGRHFKIITPAADAAHGCQLSLLMQHDGKAIFNYLSAHGVIADWREPDVIRIAPTPLYNTFEEVYQFVQLMAAAIRQTQPVKKDTHGRKKK